MDEGVGAGTEEPLRQALEIQPDHEGAITALAALLIARGETDEAIALLGRIPETPETRRLLAEARLAGPAGRRTARPSTPCLDGLLDRVRDDDAAARSSSTCWRPSGPTTRAPTDYRKALSARLF